MYVQDNVHLKGAMSTITTTQARSKLFWLVDRSNKAHETFRITSKKGNAILLSEKDYGELIETMELLSTQGVLKGVREAKRDIKARRTYSLKEVFNTTHAK